MKISLNRDMLPTKSVSPGRPAPTSTTANSQMFVTFKEIEQKIGFLDQRLIKAKKREDKVITENIRKLLEKRLHDEKARAA